MEGDEFTHNTTASVVRSVKQRITEGDPRLIPGYTNDSLARHVSLNSAQMGFYVASGMRGHEQLQMPLVDLLTSEDFQGKFNKYEVWIETFTYASQVLPRDTDTSTMMFLLMSYSRDVGPDLTQFRTVQGRVTEIQRGLLHRPAA